MRIKTEIDDKVACCGNWPWNMIADINTVKDIMAEKGFIGTPVTMITHRNNASCLTTKLRDSDKSYKQYLDEIDILEDIHIIKFNEIDLKLDSALFVTHEIDFSKYPEIGLGVFVVEVTRIGVSW